jgi:hypothetical protein
LDGDREDVQGWAPGGHPGAVIRQHDPGHRLARLQRHRGVYANAGLTITGSATLTVSGLSVADPVNVGSWSVQQNLQAGDRLYGDRTFTVASGLAGATWIRTANGSKTVTTDPLVTFSLNVPATVSVAMDTRVGRQPWLDSSWVDTGLQLTDTEGSSSRTFEVYQKEFPAGQVSLGPDADTANSGSMYTIMIS